MQNYHRNTRYGKIWEKVFERDQVCLLCNSNKDLTIDHIIPVAKGGKTTIENLRILCRACNTLEGQNGRYLDPKLEEKRNYMREWAKKNPGYFTKKSREFRANHKGYYREINQRQYRLYREAII